MDARSKLVILVVAVGLAMSTHGVSALAADGMPYVSPDSRGNCPANSTPTMFNGGLVRCHLHPRSQTDCPPKSTFRVIAGEGACTLNLDSPGYITGGHPGDTIPNPCEHDSDCPTSFCGADGRCAPPTAQH